MSVVHGGSVYQDSCNKPQKNKLEIMEPVNDKLNILFFDIVNQYDFLICPFMVQ